MAGANDSEAVVEALKADYDLSSFVNKWFDEFGINLGVHQYRELELFHRIVIRRGESNLDLDLPDVGFGVSQVLPVIVQGYLAPTDSITLVEQPEVHLRPVMQAKLADLFCEMIKLKTNGLKHPTRAYIVETHSEYFLNRLRALIALKSLDHKLVRIYSVEEAEKSGGSSIKMHAVAEGGAFKWPRHFIDADIENTKIYMES